MKVKVTRLGFINGSLAFPDDIIEVPDKLFSKSWMESLEPAKPAKGKAAEKPAEPEAGAI